MYLATTISQTLPILPELLPDSIPILVWLIGKLQSMCFIIWSAQLSTHKFVYQPSTSPEPFTYSDPDHGSKPDNGKSTGRFVVKIESGKVSWSSRLQPLLALSTTELEHILAIEVASISSWFVNSWGSLAMTFLGLHYSEWTQNTSARWSRPRFHVALPFLQPILFLGLHQLPIAQFQPFVS